PWLLVLAALGCAAPEGSPGDGEEVLYEQLDRDSRSTADGPRVLADQERALLADLVHELDGDELELAREPSGELTSKAAPCAGAPGGSSFCHPSCPCASEQGDCDSDDDCAPGLTCMRDTGALFGWDPEIDVCLPICTDIGLGTPDFCSPGCPCSAGEGDCDSDRDCADGAVCAKNVGAHFGFAADVDVCVDACDPI